MLYIYNVGSICSKISMVFSLIAGCILQLCFIVRNEYCTFLDDICAVFSVHVWFISPVNYMLK